MWEPNLIEMKESLNQMTEVVRSKWWRYIERLLKSYIRAAEDKIMQRPTIEDERTDEERKEEYEALKETLWLPGWDKFLEFFERYSTNAEACIFQKEWQSEPLYSMDDLYKRDIKSVNNILRLFDDHMKWLAFQTAALDEAAENIIDIGTADDLWTANDDLEKSHM